MALRPTDKVFAHWMDWNALVTFLFNRDTEYRTLLSALRKLCTQICLPCLNPHINIYLFIINNSHCPMAVAGLVVTGVAIFFMVSCGQWSLRVIDPLRCLRDQDELLCCVGLVQSGIKWRIFLFHYLIS